MTETSSASLPVAGENALLASRYVGALYGLAEQDGVVDELLADMFILRDLWKESAEWRFVATNPRFSNEFVCAAAEQVARIAEVEKLTANFLSVVAQNRRLKLIPLIVDYFIDEVSKRRGEYRADVRTARPLSDEQREKLASLLAKATGGKVRLVMAEDPSIIGGLTVKIGSKFVDASVKTKLDRLEHILRETSAAA